MTPRRLKLALAAFFLALAIPTAMLVWHAYDQLKWEAFYRFRLQAEELTARIDASLAEAMRDAESRGVGDYGFLVIAGDPSASFVERSPLARFPVESDVPGVLGYFQVDAAGQFSTPLVPTDNTDPGSYGVSDAELELRKQREVSIYSVLESNRLVDAAPASPSALSPVIEESVADSLATRFASGRRDDAPAVSIAPQRQALGEAREGAKAETESNAYEVAAEPVASMMAQERDPNVAQKGFDDLAEADRPPTQGIASRARPVKSSQTPRRNVDDLKLDERYAEKAPPKDGRLEAKRESADQLKRKEQVFVPAPQTDLDADLAAVQRGLRISTFESEVSPYDFRLLASGHFVLFRQVWRDGQRQIQGVLIEQSAFLQQAVETAFSNTGLYDMSNLVVAYQGHVLAELNGRAGSYPGERQDLSGALLYRARLTAPLDTLELIFSINRLPAGAGGPLLAWVAGILVLVSLAGFFMMYRYGMRQIELGRQQQDFVSAVSHELKTPLTSIRMYGEMLKEGWADEEKRQTYYNYIYDESERLSRLIANVLQLARMSRNELQVETQAIAVAELMDMTRSKVESQIERAGFQINFETDPRLADQSVDVDADAFAQIVINLVDNALKFSRGADTRVIEVGAHLQQDQVIFGVRDYGPGVPREQMKKIFKLFYRLENELTRETVGTGIGLALVHQLCQAMGGSVDVVNRQPGAEFRACFPRH